ncbi:hypothetical protein C5615_16965 [Burkholderia cepacia]|uniref:Transmembrane protein n=1 Tax=Burkholderia cepacia TaxID=292 RepID=A0A2S8IQX9_BURCE|nr:hypothetical protein [Burkholderia cepacia]PQP17153.1 hypothetical protein C5615_16965 [Burkholderia cepacia]HDR9508014.1 hypothetical protein [Burkholderia cepacia]
MSRLLSIARCVAAVGAVAAYQAGAHYAAATPGAHGFGLAMALVPPLLLALGAALRSPRRAWFVPAWLLAAAALWAARAPLAQHFEWGLYLEHASFNVAMALLFGRTLAAGEVPLCTRFATMVHGHGAVTPAIARYTRQITLAWTLFFVAIAAVSTLLFATAPIVTWSTFANYLSLPLVAVMFAAEHACRRFALPHEPRPRMIEAVRAYRATTHASQASR